MSAESRSSAAEDPGQRPAERFRRRARLRKSRQFRTVSRYGRRRGSEAFVLLAVERRDEPQGEGVAWTRESRLGVTVSRKVGNAVARNRVKRQVREWFRRGGRTRWRGMDLVVIARRPAARQTGAETTAELERLSAGVAERLR